MRKEQYEEEDVRPRKKRKKKSHRIYAFFVILLGMAILILAVLLLFYVQKVEVSGNDYYESSEIVKVVQNDRCSINSLYILGKYKLGYGETIPCMDSMKVTLKAPWTVKVTVKEKPIVGYLVAEDQYAYFDKEGLVVKMDSELREGVPCLEGAEVKDVKLFKKLKSKSKGIFEEVLECSKELKKYDMATERILCKGNRIYIYVGKICVSVGNSVSTEKIAQISPIVEKLGEKEGTLHLENYSEGTETITFTEGEFPEEN